MRVRDPKADVLDVTEAYLRGISQIFLTRNIWTGVLFLVGIAVASVPMAGFVALGTLVTTAGGTLLTRDRSAFGDGLLGYNGALIGSASYLAWSAVVPALVSTVLGSVAGVGLTWLIGRAFNGRGLRDWGLPVLTAPFCIVAGVTSTISARFVAAAPMPAEAAALTPARLLDAVLRNVGQVVFADNTVAGAVILAGLFVAGWRIGLAALGGSLLATGLALALGQDPIALRHGLFGFSAVLVAIALGTVFVQGGLTRRVVVSVLGIVAAHGLAVVLRHTPIPVYTWPFIVSTWLMVVAVRLWDRRTQSAELRASITA